MLIPLMDSPDLEVKRLSVHCLANLSVNGEKTSALIPISSLFPYCFRALLSALFLHSLSALCIMTRL